MLRLIAILLLVLSGALLVSLELTPLLKLVLIGLAFIGGMLFRRTRSAADGDDVRKPQVEILPVRPRPPQTTQSERILNAAMSSMREGVVVVDDQMRVTAFNEASRSIFPRFSGPLESRRLSELTRNKDIFSAFENAIDKGRPSETKVQMMDPETRVFDLRVIPVTLRDDEVTQGAIGVFFDITRIERLELVRQEFLSNVSHELRTPLTAILAFVETLEDGAMEDPVNSGRFLGIIRKNAERMRNLIDDILDLSAIEGGTVTVEAAVVNLREMVAEITTALSSRADERNVRIINDVEPETFVYADARRLEQMLTNLVDNGTKFNVMGGTVRVAHEALEKDRIIVSDTGEGIAPEHAARIFERFYRVDRARSRDMGGTGLGLAIVKHLARLHGGEVSVSSAIGEGSTFTIDLPKAPSIKEETFEKDLSTAPI